MFSSVSHLASIIPFQGKHKTGARTIGSIFKRSAVHYRQFTGNVQSKTGRCFTARGPRGKALKPLKEARPVFQRDTGSGITNSYPDVVLSADADRNRPSGRSKFDRIVYQVIQNAPYRRSIGEYPGDIPGFVDGNRLLLLPARFEISRTVRSSSSDNSTGSSQRV